MSGPLFATLGSAHDEAFRTAPSETLKVSYLDDPASGSMIVTVIRRWKRGEMEGPIMSGSSGPKDYLRNHVWEIFDRFGDVQGVWLVRGRYATSAMFLLLADPTGRLFDITGQEVEVWKG
jgi:hypothetical protein